MAPTAELAPEFAPVETQIITRKPDALDIAAVIYTGDTLTMRQKRAPQWRMGGKLAPYPDFQTIPNQIVERCKITRLQPAMRSVHKAQVDKEKWDLYVQSYTKTNQWDPQRREFVSIEVGTSGPSLDLLFKSLPASAERGMLERDGDGVVFLEGDAYLASAEAIKAAQLHYFPEWLEIRAGQKHLPERLAELEDHIRTQQAKTQSTNFRAVGDAFLFSIQSFRDWAKEYVDRQAAAMKETEGKGVAVRYDEIAERLFVMCDLTREDKLVSSIALNNATAAAQNNDVGTAISLLTQLLLDREQKAVAAAPAPEEQPPAPSTIEEAADEFARDSGEAYVDMTAATLPDEDEEVVAEQPENVSLGIEDDRLGEAAQTEAFEE